MVQRPLGACDVNDYSGIRNFYLSRRDILAKEVDAIQSKHLPHPAHALPEFLPAWTVLWCAVHRPSAEHGGVWCMCPLSDSSELLQVLVDDARCSGRATTSSTKHTPSHGTACIDHRRGLSAYQRSGANFEPLPRSRRLHAPTPYHHPVGASTSPAGLIRRSPPTPTKPCPLHRRRLIPPRSSITYALILHNRLPLLVVGLISRCLVNCALRFVSQLSLIGWPNSVRVLRSAIFVVTRAAGIHISSIDLC